MRVPWTTSESDTAAVACSISSPRLCNRFSVTLQCWLAMLAGCSTTANPVCHCTRRTAGDQDMTDSVTVENGVAYANHDGVELVGDLYLPQAAKYLPKPPKGSPALVAVHGGGWVAGARSAFQYWGPYLCRARHRGFCYLLSARDQIQDIPRSGAGRACRRAIPPR